MGEAIQNDHFDFNLLRTRGEYLLVTTDDFFTAPDGQLYKAVWGNAVLYNAQDMFGFRPSGDTNWYLQVGRPNRALFIAGCRIHYAQVCLEKPKGSSIYYAD